MHELSYCKGKSERYFTLRKDVCGGVGGGLNFYPITLTRMGEVRYEINETSIWFGI